METQKLPAVEPGHTSNQKLPRVEGVGVQDAVVPSAYPKWVNHPRRGLTLAETPEYEAMLHLEISMLPAEPELTEDEVAKIALEKILGRVLTGLEMKIGASNLLALDKGLATVVVFHPDSINVHVDEPLDDFPPYEATKKAPVVSDSTVMYPDDFPEEPEPVEVPEAPEVPEPEPTEE